MKLNHLNLAVSDVAEAQNFLSTTTIFGTPLDVALDELAIEAFFPADEATAWAMRVAAR